MARNSSASMRLRTGFIIGLCLAASSVLAAQQYGPIRAGEGVYAVASQFRDRSGDLNLRQWALAIYALNPQAFGNGLGSLRRGSQLQIPVESRVSELWPLGKALLDGAEQAAIAEQVATIMAASPDSAVAKPDPVVPGKTVVTESVAGAEVATPQPYYSWFLKSPDEPETTAAPEADTALPATAAAQSAESPLTAAEDAPQQEPQEQAVEDGDAQVALALPSEEEPTTEAFADTELFRRAQAASGGGNVDKVLSLLREAEPQYAGDTDFDYIYGVLLIDAARPQEAIYPLLRAFQQEPGDLGIQLDLGRAYFQSGENETARKIFTELAGQQPPPQAELVIDSYLRAIEQRAGRYERQLTSELALFSGFDSNANNASSLTEFAGFFLDDAARSTESPYALLQAQSRLTQPLGPRFNLQFGGDVRSRRYQDAPEFSNTRWSLDTGLQFRRGDISLLANLTGGQNYVDGEDNHDFAAVTTGLEWRSSVDRRLTASAKYGALRYADGLTVRDVDQALVSLGFGQRLNWAFGTDIGFDLAVGQDEAQEAGSPFGRDLLGASVRGVIQIQPALQFNFASHYLEADYDGQFVGLARKDEQWFTDLSLQLTHNRFKNWTAELLGRYVDNRSSVALYDYDRVELGLGLKWLLN